ncbi:rhodanese-like domain-containing protein [Pseudoteredinibacter isoporae]|uniref:rhodanese-like domain-containing protein n=1 Tax=Pseudoteredinibacter isoporae TaxID=570281 RepID=UPI00142188AF|nr:rhodanese-like domain-containing protein [Pseudoteredinibacter isoporae]NHO85443.1 rhodanese-like domain-containing protein [Pseudoteredinibacter isoporae]NIB26105.1 rhodanese-like domain-containing protein [Pseudoteredinibacter isoporae]
MVFVTEQWLLVSILLGLIFFYVFTEKQKGGKTISSHELTRLVNDGEAVILDVRETKEFNAGHIVDALNIPFNTMEKRIVELDKHEGKTIVVVDKMGQHAGAVGKQLAQRGFSVNRLSGGMMDWQGQNLPVVKK